MDEPLPIPVGDEMTTIGHSIGSHIAWPKVLVIFDNMPVRVSSFFFKLLIISFSLTKNLYQYIQSTKRLKRSHPNENIFDAPSSFILDNNMQPDKMTEATNYASSVPMPNRLARLWTYIDKNCGANDSIQLELHGNILGIETTILLFKDDIKDFSFFQEIGAPVITVYYMYDKIFILLFGGASCILSIDMFIYLFFLNLDIFIESWSRKRQQASLNLQILPQLLF